MAVIASSANVLLLFAFFVLGLAISIALSAALGLVFFIADRFTINLLNILFCFLPGVCLVDKLFYSYLLISCCW